MQVATLATWSGYSLAERDRRWNAVRAEAARAGLDCVFVPVCLDARNFPPSQDQTGGSRSDSRYLTQIDGAAFVLPTDGRDPITIAERAGPTRWIDEVRGVSRPGMSDSWAGPMAKALRDAGMERARIGVAGLGRGKLGHVQAADGVANYTALAGVVAQLPHATFENATDIVGSARYIKGEEEIACLRRAAEIAAAGCAELELAARPGVAEAAVYARGMRRILELGSEYVPLALRAEPAGRLRYEHRNPALGRTLGPGWLLEADVNAGWGGQRAQESISMLLGPLSDSYRLAADFQRDVFHAIMAGLTPGRDLADLADRVETQGKRHDRRSAILLQSAGYGDDGPLLTGDRKDSLRVPG